MAYIYRHIRLDKNQPFYIGIGGDSNFKRAYNKLKRNDYWKSIIAITDYEVEIVMDDLSWDDACKKEIEFIKMYGRKNNDTGFLSNMTDGGEGTKGKIFSEEFKKNLSNRNIGNNYYLNKIKFNHTQESKNKISQSIKGENHPRFGTKKSKEEITKSIISKGGKEFYVYLNDKIIAKYLSQQNCADDLRINRAAINMCLKNKRKHTSNYTFRYVEEVINTKIK
jgi:hypothetical protein